MHLLFEIETSLTINPESVKPYTVDYNILINDEGFKKRITNIQQQHLIEYRFDSLLFFSKVSFICHENNHSNLLTINNTRSSNNYTFIKLIGSKDSINFRNRKNAEKFRVSLEKELNRFMSNEQLEYKKLIREAQAV